MSALLLGHTILGECPNPRHLTGMMLITLGLMAVDYGLLGRSWGASHAGRSTSSGGRSVAALLYWMQGRLTGHRTAPLSRRNADSLAGLGIEESQRAGSHSDFDAVAGLERRTRGESADEGDALVGLRYHFEFRRILDIVR